MGLYSTNRISSLMEAETATDEEIKFDQIMPTGNVGSMMEACIQMHENDQKMFDSLIELDFVEAAILKEADENGASEEEKKNAASAGDSQKKESIFKKILTFIENFIETVKNKAAQIIAKINEVLKRDKKLFDQYAGVLTYKNLEGFPGIKNFGMPETAALITKNDAEKVAKITKFKDAFNHAVSGFEDAEDSNATFEAIQKLEGELEADQKEFEDGLAKRAFDKTKDGVMWKPDTTSIATMKAYNTTCAGVIGAISSTANKIIKDLKDEKAEINKSRNKRKNSADDVKVANAQYTFISKLIKVYSKRFGSLTNVAVGQIGACRKAIIVCGSYASKKAKKGVPEKTTEAPREDEDPTVMPESVEYEFLAECSDQFMENMFA